MKMAQTLKSVRGKRLNGAVLASLIAVVTVIIAGLYLFITTFYDSGGSWNPLEILTFFSPLYIFNVL